MSNNQYTSQFAKQETPGSTWNGVPTTAQAQPYTFPNAEAEQAYNASVQAYYQQYYNNYYANASGQNYTYPTSQQYQQTAAGTYNYTYQNGAATPGATQAAPQTSSHDYSQWYQQQGYSYPYNGSTYQNYGQYPNGYSNTYATTATQASPATRPTAPTAEKPAENHNPVVPASNNIQNNLTPQIPLHPPPPPPKIMSATPSLKATGSNSFPVGKKGNSSFDPALPADR